MTLIEKTQSKRTRNLRLPPEKRVADIIAAARKILSEKDYEAALISEIAEEAGIVEGTIYRYFENKRDLFIKVAEDWFEEILSQNKSFAKVDGTLNQLKSVIWWVLSIIHKEPALTRFVLMELRPHPDYTKTRVYELNKKFTEEVMAVFREAMKSGELDDKYELTFVRDMVFGCIEHQTWSYLRHLGDYSTDDLSEKIANIMYNGLLKNSPKNDNNIDNAISRLETIVDELKIHSHQV
ncbi:MAG: helix-turn-helix domain-containing protein [Porticoccaceae bacterium]|nr:TetR/AcrR family transcriptional regulator [Pseudomonadales bacterium]MCP5171136.1 TetR/AcrR family transcriptional regulator [Pseudomonadales bacterium]MCP5301627.1 TetR/AcrR family transcriptional regulator [Pseudomonadales bacterium]